MHSNEERNHKHEPHTHEFTHTHEITHSHSGEPGHTHQGHTHSHKQTKVVINRLARAIGHLEAVKRMVESGRECNEVLIQLSAVNSALKSVSKIILQDHIDNCIVDAVMNNDQEKIEKLKEAIDKMMK